MYGCFLTNVDYGDANYGTNEEMRVALTIRFDNMVQWGAGEQGVGVGIGANVGRTIGESTTGSSGAQG